MIERLIPACILIQIEKYMRKVEKKGEFNKVELISKHKNLNLKLLAGNKSKILHIGITFLT